MFQVSGNSPTYAKCILTPPQSAQRMKKHAAVSVSNTAAPSLCRRNTVSHRSRRYHSGNWVTSDTIRYINITGGHSYKKGGCIRSRVGHFPPCTIHFQQGAQKKSIHAINPGRKKKKKNRQKCATNRVNKTLSKKQREEQNGGLGLRWRIHTKL